MKRRIGKILFSLWIVALACASIAGFSASASTPTYGFYITFPRETSSTQYSQSAPKQTSSNLYVNCTQSQMTFQVMPYYGNNIPAWNWAGAYIKQGQAMQLSWNNKPYGGTNTGGIMAINSSSNVPYSWNASINYKMDV